MNGRKNTPWIALGNAFVLVSVAALTLVLTALLLARVGMPFTEAYTVSMIACIAGTLAVSRKERTLIALPSPAITAWLVYEEIIAHGLSWQEGLGIAAVISLIGAFLTRTKCIHSLTGALPPIVRIGLVLSLGVAMFLTAALYARILLPSPWALTMGGTLSDPLTYFTLMGILLVLLLCARNVSAALPLGMLAVGVLTWAEGFWEIPAAPFLEPELSTAAFALVLPQSDLLSAAALGLTLLLALMIESMAVLTARGDAADQQLTFTRLFAVSGCMGFLGAFPLTIAPISTALPEGGEEHTIAGIPLTALLSALLLLLLLPCAILMQALADFPAVPAIALAVMGLLLLMRALCMLRDVREFTLRESTVIVVFLLAAYDIKTGLTAALLMWVLLTASRGEYRHISHSTWGLTALLVTFFLLKWILIEAFRL